MGERVAVGDGHFLFTDLEGSTRLWEEHPDAMQSALARHDEILRDSVAVHGGQIVKTTGDGIHAVFAIARDAVEAAVAAQRALGTADWEMDEPVTVRGVPAGPLRRRGPAPSAR